MKTLPRKARKLIELLVHTTSSVTECLAEAGVPSSTYYGRWRKDPVFLEALIDARQTFEAEVRGRFVSKRRRIEELTALYEQVPLLSDEFWMGGSKKRTWINADEKRAILEQIRKELEGIDIRLGEPGAADHLDLIQRRRQADADLAEFEAGMGQADDAPDDLDD